MKRTEELTTAMHSEFSVSEETDIKHRVHTALLSIEIGAFTRAEAMDAYNITEAQLEKYEPEYESLK